MTATALAGIRGMRDRIGDVLSIGHVRMMVTGQTVPFFESSPTKECFMKEEDGFSCDPRLDQVLGDIMPISSTGSLVECQMVRDHGELIFAAMMKIGTRAWQEDAKRAAVAIIKVGAQFTIKQVEYLFNSGDESWSRFRPADGEGCNYFPVISEDGLIHFLEVHRPNLQCRGGQSVHRVEVIPYDKIRTYTCDPGDKLFLRNPIMQN